MSGSLSPIVYWNFKMFKSESQTVQIVRLRWFITICYDHRAGTNCQKLFKSYSEPNMFLIDLERWRSNFRRLELASAHPLRWLVVSSHLLPLKWLLGRPHLQKVRFSARPIFSSRRSVQDVQSQLSVPISSSNLQSQLSVVEVQS